MKHKWQLWLLMVPILMAVLLMVSLHLESAADPEMLSRAEDTSRRSVNWCFWFIGLQCIAYWLYCGLRCGWRIPGLKLWPLMGGVLLGRALVMHILLERGVTLHIPAKLYFAFHLVCLTAFLSMTALLVVMARYAYRKCPAGVKSLIVLGCLSESPVLFARADAAGRYLLLNPESVAVCSGGRGGNESISEAESIRNRILTLGVDGGRLLTEDRSRNTLQNLRNSAALLPDPAAAVAVVTDDYHQFRACFIARSVLKGKVYGIPVHTSRVTMPHYLVKEFFSFLLLLAKRAAGRRD